MTIRIIPEAAAEFADAVDHYESIEPGLGMRLKQEVKDAISWIADYSEVPRLRPEGHRRVNLRIFPYYIAYLIHLEIIWVIAVAHSARHPRHFVTRPIPNQSDAGPEDE